MAYTDFTKDPFSNIELAHNVYEANYRKILTTASKRYRFVLSGIIPINRG